MKKSARSGHHFEPEHGFTGSRSAAGPKSYVAGYFRGGRVKHDDEAQDKQPVRSETKRGLKKR